MQYYPLERLHQLYEGYQRPFRVGDKDVLLVQSDGHTYLIENRCHADAPLTYATVSSNRIRCPLHGIEFSLSTGAPHMSGCRKGLIKLTPAYEGQTVGIYL